MCEVRMILPRLGKEGKRVWHVICFSCPRCWSRSARTKASSFLPSPVMDVVRTHFLVSSTMLSHNSQYTFRPPYQNPRTLHSSSTFLQRDFHGMTVALRTSKTDEQICQIFSSLTSFCYRERCASQARSGHPRTLRPYSVSWPPSSNRSTTD